MFYISETKSNAPEEFQSELQQEIYGQLKKAGIAFQRVDTDEAITMEDCVAINAALDMEMVKTLFLCNRQQTDFYIFVTKGNKPFSSKDFSHALDISRVSFAPAELMQTMLGTPIGAATVLSAVIAPANVAFIFDNEIVTMQSYGCSDGTTTGYIKISIDDVFAYLRSLGKNWQVITL